MASSATTTTPTTTTSLPPPHVPLPNAGDFVHAFLPFWPLYALVLGIVLLGAAKAARRNRRLARSGIRDIDRMDGTTFERRLGMLFRHQGYAVELTGRSRGDYGCDLVISRNGERISVQAKRWTKNVGIKAVQEAAASRLHYKADTAMVVTNRYFTQQARALARSNNVTLWDRERLVQELLGTPFAKAPAMVAESVATESPPPQCAQCGKDVSQRVYEYCVAHSARFKGLIYCYEHQRAR